MLGRDGHTVEENLALALLSPLGEDAGSTASECAGATCPLMQCPGGQGHFFPDVSPAQSVCVTAGTLLCYRSRLLEDSSCMDGHTKWPPRREPRQGMTNGRCSCSGEPVWPQLKEAVTLGRMRTRTRAQSLPSKSVAHLQCSNNLVLCLVTYYPPVHPFHSLPRSAPGRRSMLPFPFSGLSLSLSPHSWKKTHQCNQYSHLKGVRAYNAQERDWWLFSFISFYIILFSYVNTI